MSQKRTHLPALFFSRRTRPKSRNFTCSFSSVGCSEKFITGDCNLQSLFSTGNVLFVSGCFQNEVFAAFGHWLMKNEFLRFQYTVDTSKLVCHILPKMLFIYSVKNRCVKSPNLQLCSLGRLFRELLPPLCIYGISEVKLCFKLAPVWTSPARLGKTSKISSLLAGPIFAVHIFKHISKVSLVLYM